MKRLGSTGSMQCVGVAYPLIRGVLLSTALLPGRLDALDPAQKITQYAHTAWNREHGQMSASVEALAQTPDGTLWLGTDSGLLRFDGVRFERWRPPAGQQTISESILALAADRDGGLWIGTREALSYWKQDTVQSYKTSAGPVAAVVNSLLVDRAGTVWAGLAGYRTGGLCRIRNRQLECDKSPEHLPGFGVLSLYQDRNGVLWASGTGLCRWTSGAVPDCIWKDANQPVYGIADNPKGEVWAGGRGLKDSRKGQPALPGLDPRLEITALLTDRDGALWIGTRGQGLFHLYQDRIDRFAQSDGLSNDTVLSLLQDKEGSIWAGTDGGLDRFREYAVTRISRQEGMLPGNVTSLFPARAGGVWIGTMNGLNHLKGPGVPASDRQIGLPSGEVTGIFEEENGRLWGSTLGGLAYLEHGRFRLLRLPSVGKIWFRSAAETRDHSVWFSDPNNGLIRVRGTQIVDIIPWSRFSNQPAFALEPDPIDGGLWLGFSQGDVAYYQTGLPTRWYLRPQGPHRKPVWDLHRSRDGSLWIASASGLSRLWNGRIRTLGVPNGLPCEDVRAIVEDESGALWLSTGCGLVSIPPDELRKWCNDPAARIRMRTFDENDGMRLGTRFGGYFRRSVRSADGRIWFADSDAVAIVNPRRLPHNPIAPAVKIEEVDAAQNTYPATAPLRLPPHTDEVRIRYTAMSLALPERVRFRYRLDGFDPVWKDAAGREASYTNLPPSHYRFHVIACNNDGVWNQAGASFDFSIQPAVYQTRAFQFASVCAFIALLWTAHRLRLRHERLRLSAQYQTRLEERTRIAREMHDSLLQNLCGFGLQLDALAKMRALPDTARDRLREIRVDAEKCAREVREFVWDLRAPTLEEVDLCQTLREAGEQVLQGASVSFQFTVQGTPRPASARLQRQLSRIVQEAARNAVRYSRAKEIGMDLAYIDSDRIRLLMRDDGCGFDPADALRQAGHWGLKTMQERARELGGELTISSGPGQGTMIEVVVPAGSPA
jgi:signal transduction histidine kinase/ligand-binding sensor domain-containing protein